MSSRWLHDPMQANGRTSLTIRALVVRSSTAALILLGACTGGKQKATDSAPAALAPPLPIAPKTPADTCVKNGLWAECSVERRLKQSGFVFKPLDTASH